eukprot:gene28382-37315_t
MPKNYSSSKASSANVKFFRKRTLFEYVSSSSTPETKIVQLDICSITPRLLVLSDREPCWRLCLAACRFTWCAEPSSRASICGALCALACSVVVVGGAWSRGYSIL